jgi:hypothetical protein
VTDLPSVVARSADLAGLHAPAPAMLLELQTTLGAVAASATAATDRGRKPFRPDETWAARLGELAYGVYLLADQTGVDLPARVLATAQALERHANRRQAAPAGGEWPFPAH